jgi:endoribonuclease Dicer
MHTARQKYISNQQLCNIASRLGLPGYIQLKPFSIKSWMPPGMTVVEPQKKELPAVNASEPSNITFPQQTSVSSKPNDDSLIDSNQGKGSKNRKKRVKKNAYFSPIANKVYFRSSFLEAFSDSVKTVADVVEAIIGAAYISGGRESALKAAKSLRIPFTEVEEWSDFDRRECTPQMGINRFLDTSAVAVIEDTTGHTFRKRHLLALALVSFAVPLFDVKIKRNAKTHSTFNTAEMKIHQRLEFIGDAVLDFCKH